MLSFVLLVCHVHEPAVDSTVPSLSPPLLRPRYPNLNHNHKPNPNPSPPPSLPRPRHPNPNPPLPPSLPQPRSARRSCGMCPCTRLSARPATFGAYLQHGTGSVLPSLLLLSYLAGLWDVSCTRWLLVGRRLNLERKDCSNWSEMSTPYTFGFIFVASHQTRGICKKYSIWIIYAVDIVRQFESLLAERFVCGEAMNATG